MQTERPRSPVVRARRWRHSLYGRAALFVALGSACLLGAVAKLSSTVADDSVKRLLGERIRLARTVATYFENRMRGDLEHLAAGVLPLLDNGTAPPNPDKLAASLDRHSASTAFSEGAMVFDPEGHPLASVPDRLEGVRSAFDLGALVERARKRNDLAASPLRYIGLKAVVLMVAPVNSRGRLVGFVGGLLQPAATDVLEAFRRADESSHTEFRVIDQMGTVVASTNRHNLYRRGDHGDVLADAIANRRDLQGRCHSCHEESQERKTDVLAFAPLPTIDYGLAVQQPENEVLDPAFALRRRMFFLGFVYITLFVIFAGLSVRAVVKPIRRLTDAVNTAEENRAGLPKRPYGKDEVGELARALTVWQERTVRSLEEAERHRRALNDEIEATQRHLGVLLEIAALSTKADGLQVISRRTLDQALGALDLTVGVICLRYRSREFPAFRGMVREDVDQLLEDVCEVSGGPPPALAPGEEERIRFDDLSNTELPGSGKSFRTLVGARLDSPQGLRVTAVLGHPTEHRTIEKRWLDSLLRHVRMSVSNLLLREADKEREAHQRKYLHRVLQAQEDERRRVARELHDTLAQDLAAIRLDIERIAGRVEAASVRTQLEALDQRSQKAHQAVRRLLLDLRLSVLDSTGFLPALQWHLERFQKENHVRCTLLVDGEEETELQYETAVTLFRISQESLQNAVQHGKAEQIFVTVGYLGESVELWIEDDGVGFEVSDAGAGSPSEHGRGLGILGMEERARLLGGTFEIESSPGDGTTITVRVPLSPTGAALGLAEENEEEG